MKKFTFLFLLFSLIFSTTSNAQILYGLKKSVAGSPTLPFDIVSIDPFTASTTTLFSTNSLTAVAAGATAYDQQNQRFICWGFDNNFNQKLYVADIDSGTVVSQPIISASPIEMEYDLQKQKTYGLWYANNIEHFGTVDLNNGQVTTIATLPGVEAVAIGHSTFDSNLGRYIFLGIENGVKKLITLNAATGSVIHSAPITTSIGAFEYDVTANKLFGIYNEMDSSNQNPIFQTYYNYVKFVEIDLATANHTVVDSTPINQGYLTGYAVGGLAFDQATQTYIMHAADDTSFRLIMVNTVSGQLISSIPFTDVFEIQVDNISFARTFYNLTNTKAIVNAIEGKIFPNPATHYLNIEVEGEIQHLTIFDLKGRMIQKIQNNFSTINISQLQNGMYILQATTNDGIFSKPFIKN